MNYFFDFRFVDLFRRYSRSNSKVVRNCAGFWTFFAIQILGDRPSKNCTHIITPSSRHVVWIKICDDIPISPDVIDLHTLNFKPNLSFVDQSSRSFFFQRGRGCSWSTTFPIFDLWIRFGDIRDQNRKLSAIVPNFGRFLPSQILGGRPSKNCTHVIIPGSLHVVCIKICDDIPFSPELIDVHTLNFKPNFKFSRLKFFGGTPVGVGVCAR